MNNIMNITGENYIDLADTPIWWQTTLYGSHGRGAADGGGSEPSFGL